MSKDFNISMICLILNWFVYDPSWMLHLSKFVWTLGSLVLVVFNNFLLIKTQQIEVRLVVIKSAFFIALSLYPLSFFANTPFKTEITESEFDEFESRLKFAKNRLKLIAGLNLETLNTFFSGTNYILVASQILASA